MLDHFILRGTLEELPDLIRHRYGGYYDRAVPYLPLRETDPERLAEFVRRRWLRSSSATDQSFSERRR